MLASCTFTGKADTVRVEGNGPVVFVHHAPFSKGAASRVVLEGAQIGTSGPKRLVFENPADLLAPVQMDEPPGGDYAVTYTAGPPLVIRIEKGGTNGSFHGKLDTHPECEKENEVCELRWAGPEKQISLERKKTERTLLAKGFDLNPDLDAKPSPQAIGLHSVVLHGVSGTLDCGQGKQDVRDLAQHWLRGPAASLSLGEGVWIGPDGLFEVHLSNEAAPVRFPQAWPAFQSLKPVQAQVGVDGRLGLGLGAALLVLVVVGLLVAKRLGVGKVQPPQPTPPPPQAQPEPTKKPVRIFYSYDREDAELRNALAKHLVVLKNNGEIVEFDDREIIPGTEWAKEIDNNLKEADLVLMLVSKHFLASESCDLEMNMALDMHRQGKAKTIPVILRPCLWEESPLAKLAALPSNGEPITAWEDEDAALADVAEGIKKAVRAIAKSAPK